MLVVGFNSVDKNLNPVQQTSNLAEEVPGWIERSVTKMESVQVRLLEEWSMVCEFFWFYSYGSNSCHCVCVCLLVCLCTGGSGVGGEVDSIPSYEISMSLTLIFSDLAVCCRCTPAEDPAVS